MKIIIIGPAHPLRGGLASFNERLAKEFQLQGNEVSIYTFSLQYPNFIFPGTTQYSTEPAPKDLKIKVCINSVNPFNWIKVGTFKKRKRRFNYCTLLATVNGTLLRNNFTKSKKK